MLMEVEIIVWALLSPENNVNHKSASETTCRAMEKLMKVINNISEEEGATVQSGE